MKPLTMQEASNVLSAWTVLEVLSPRTFCKAEDLVGGEKSLVALLDNGLPWENGGEEVPPEKKLFYQIIMGSISLQSVFSALVKKYGDTSVESKQVSGEAITGVITVDQHGCLLKNDISVNLSSFAWGAPQALKNSLENLRDWALVKQKMEIAFDGSLRKKDENGKELPLNKIMIDEAYTYLTNNIYGISAEMLINKKFALRTYELRKKGDPESSKKDDPESSEKDGPTKTVLLKSFYLNDLAKASTLIANTLAQNQDTSSASSASTNLLQYLGVNDLKRQNILDKTVLQNILSPKNIPSARWPGLGRHPLVLLQQAAVNLSMTELKDSGILAINGPPGTGKTTLLRDIVAKLVAERAEALLNFVDPEQAFIDSGEKIQARKGWFKIYKLDERLKGFEILIASSNNKAVENISTELPSLKAIADNANDLRYFKALSDSLLGGGSWGLIAAVLGNMTNCKNFNEKFWWDKDFSFSTYLAEINGKSQKFEIKDPDSHEIIETIYPKIIEENNPPSSHSEALERWKEAKENFEKTLKASRDELSKLQETRNLVEELENLEKELGKVEDIEDFLLKHDKLKPHIIWCILNTPSFRAWREERKKIRQKIVCLNYKKKKIVTSSKEFENHLIDSSLFAKSSEEMHLVSPWCNEQTQLLRDEVFISAIKLHKAFIDAAAKPLHHNLGAMMKIFRDSFNVIDKSTTDFLLDLWASFFLVVPSVSTTFASVEKMLKDIPANSLGWLIIDEAGQALPQAAVGAIMRTKRVVVTGDPLQIEPVVDLPDNLTKSICKQFSVDPKRFNAPEASVQTLSDFANSYIYEFDTKHGSRLVGVPLLVHRRCGNPMFDISNIIAYGESMVHAKSSDSSSAIHKCLGSSKWFDVQGEASDKWCPEEGQKVLELLGTLKSAGIQPNLYIVTPFRVVANNLRKIIKDSHILKSWITTDSYSWLNERVGTIHTVQGREAEAVILVLGAQGSDQEGSRVWVGKFPNILNVAVTRAKEVIYVIGNRDLWKEVGVFRELDSRIKLK
ncbi:DEAD/DEAH box helicase [Candidatus Tisiphia endosymbiont of Mystacides longicornis]|uniref:DEAD/DEAH box helicase n=1 Tax=Candidatus Tisiphia endosymbiont of Mystacides longicornis TaxID=3139330 RepID=UPI003CCA8134